MKSIIVFLTTVAAAIMLADCGGGGAGSSPLPAGSTAIVAPASSSVTSTGGNVNSVTAAPIAGDPLPSPITAGTTYSFATCVPVFDDLASGTGLGSWLQVGCASSAVANSTDWIINGNTSPALDCVLRYDVVTDDVIEFFCSGNPYA